MSSDIEFKHSKKLIELRRSKVLELISLGFQQNEIAQQLKVAPSTVSLDVQFLKETARDNLKDYVEHRIPEQFQECNSVLKLVLRKAYELYNASSKTSERIQSLSLLSETASKLDELSTDSKILDQAVSWIEKKKTQLLQMEQQQQSQLQTEEDQMEEEEIETEDG